MIILKKRSDPTFHVELAESGYEPPIRMPDGRSINQINCVQNGKIATVYTWIPLDICSCCGCVVPENELDYINGEKVCKDCRINCWTVCGHCGEWVRNTDLLEYDGIFVCPNCYDELVNSQEPAFISIYVQNRTTGDGSCVINVEAGSAGGGVSPGNSQYFSCYETEPISFQIAGSIPVGSHVNVYIDGIKVDQLGPTGGNAHFATIDHTIDPYEYGYAGGDFNFMIEFGY
jgi:hypothetical protein